MARNKLSRISLHRKICELSGVNLKSEFGYLSRREMLELYDYLKRVKETCDLLKRLHNETVNQTIIEGKIHNEPSCFRNKHI
jgi:hypothetical protein